MKSFLGGSRIKIQYFNGSVGNTCYEEMTKNLPYNYKQNT